MQPAPSYIHQQFYKRTIVFYGSLSLFCVFMVAAALSEPLKYLKYSLPVLLLAVLLVYSKRFTLQLDRLRKARSFHYLTGLLVFYLIAFATNLIKGFSNGRFYQEVYFVLSPLFFAFLLFLLRPANDYGRAIKLLFWGIAAAFIAEKFPFFIEEVKHPFLIVDAFLTSDLATESNFAFEFGLFFIVFSEEKNKRYGLLSAILLILSFKRIALAAVVFYFILAALRKLSRQKLHPAGNKVLLLTANGLVVLLLFLFFTGTFDDFIEETFGVSSNFITQGRYNIYQDIFHHFGKIDFFGFGLGAINTFLSHTGYELVNLHSDLLKVFFELGPLLFIAWIYFFHKWANTFLSACLAIYMNVLFLTDNVFIYFDVMFVFYIAMLYSFEKQRHKEEHLSSTKGKKAHPGLTNKEYSNE